MATQPYQLALDRQQETTRETDKSAMMTEARKALARQQSAGYPTQPLNIMGNQQPTPQQRDMATGQMGPALAGAKPQPGPAHATGLAQAAIKAAAPAQRNSAALAVGNPQQEFLQRQQFFQEQQNKRRQFDLQMDQARLAQERQALAQQAQMGQGVPAVLEPLEAVIPAQQTLRLAQQGTLPQTLGMTPEQFALNQQARQQQANPWNVQRFDTGGVVPTTGVTVTQPTLGAQLPATGVQSLPPRPVVGPVTPGQPSYGGTDFGALNQQISAFGPAPTLDEATMARIRAQESQRLMNIERASLNELGASAASQGALLGGDVRSIAAGFASDRLAAESRLGTDLAVQKLGMEREDYARKFGLAGQLALQREQQGFSSQEAELDRRWRSGEALSEREFAALEAAKQREFQRTERLGTQGFTAQEADLDRRWRSGERLSDQEWQTLERARDRQQQTSERLGSQLFTAEESQKQRALITDENAKDRLSQMALAEKNIEATRQNLETQLAQARSENNLDRVQQLEVQRRDLDQQYAQLRQQNDQFLADMGLRRDVFDRGMVEFDLTRADQVGQFAQNLDLQNRQLLQNLDISRMDDATRRYTAELTDRFNRDLNAAAIDPTVLQTILSAAGSLAPILQGLGISGSDIVGGVRSLFGGGVSPGDFSEANLVYDEAGNIVSSGPAGAASSGSGIPWSTVGQAALGAAGAYALIEAFNDPRSFGRTAQMIAGGAAIGSVLPGVGTLVGAGISAVASGIASAFGPSARTIAKDAFTAEFDKAYQGSIERMLSLPPTDPNSWANPQNRLAYAAAFAPAVQKAAALDVGDVEISDVDWRRMEGLGLAASVQGTDRARFYAIDDPRLIAMMGPGGANQYFTFSVPHQNNDQVYANAQGSLGAFIADGTLTVRDKVTGEIIDFNNPEQLKAIAARNNPTGAAPAPVSTPPKQPVGVV